MATDIQKYLAKFGRMDFEYASRQTNRQTQSSQYFEPLQGTKYM